MKITETRWKEGKESQHCQSAVRICCCKQRKLNECWYDLVRPAAKEAFSSTSSQPVKDFFGRLAVLLWMGEGFKHIYTHFCLLISVEWAERVCNVVCVFDNAIDERNLRKLTGRLISADNYYVTSPVLIKVLCEGWKCAFVRGYPWCSNGIVRRYTF